MDHRNNDPYEREKARALSSPETAIRWWEDAEDAAALLRDATLNALLGVLSRVFMDPMGAVIPLLADWRDNGAKAALSLANCPENYGSLRKELSPIERQDLIRDLADGSSASPVKLFRYDGDLNVAFDALSELEEKHSDIFARVAFKWDDDASESFHLLDDILNIDRDERQTRSLR